MVLLAGIYYPEGYTITVRAPSNVTGQTISGEYRDIWYNSSKVIELKSHQEPLTEIEGN